MYGKLVCHVLHHEITVLERERESVVASRKSCEGSGVVVRADGLVVTNHHVVENGASFEVVFTDGAKRRADLLGSDESIDLAVLRIRGEGVYLPMNLRT